MASSFVIHNGDTTTLDTDGPQIDNFFKQYPNLKRYVACFEETNSEGVKTFPSQLTYNFKPNCRYELKPRNADFHWVFTGKGEDTNKVITKLGKTYAGNLTCVEYLTKRNMAIDREGFEAFEFSSGDTAHKVAAISMIQSFRVRENRPNVSEGVYLNDTDTLDVDKDYTLMIDLSDTVNGFSAKDGPFAVATIGLFISGMINNYKHPSSPAFVVAVIGAGLWCSVLMLVFFLKILEFAACCADNSCEGRVNSFKGEGRCPKGFTNRHFQDAVIAISWCFGILLAVIVIILGGVSSAKN